MQTLLLPANSGISAVARPSPPVILRQGFSRGPLSFYRLVSDLSSFNKSCSIYPFQPLGAHRSRGLKSVFAVSASLSASPASSSFVSAEDESDKVKLAQVAKRLETTSRYFRRLGNFGFWGQLTCTLVSAVILSFSAVVTGKPISSATFYATAGGIVAAFVSVFWSFGYIRLSEKLRRTATSPSKAPPRADVVNGLKNGIIVNVLGMGATILGMLATVGFLAAKALTTSTTFSQGVSPGNGPILPLDVFLVQASANTILSHFIGLVCSLELLRSVTLSPSATTFVPKAA